MNRSFGFLAALLIGGASPASADILETDTVGGHIRFDVNGAGGIVSSFYDPVGPDDNIRILGPSGMYLGFSDEVQRRYLDEIVPTTFSGDSLSRTSTFSIGGLDFALTQSLAPFFDGSGTQMGTALKQIYSFTNSGASARSFDMVRYLDADLWFNGEESFADNGGGRITNGGRTTLFTTQIPTSGPSVPTQFVGSFVGGGYSTGYWHYDGEELDRQTFLGTRLPNQISGDPNNDGWVDPRFIEDDVVGDDLGTALGRGFKLAPGESGRFAATTLFGFGAPSEVVIAAVPEPATWLMMITGFLMAGSLLRSGNARGPAHHLGRLQRI